jgi:hypothetical protein
VKTVRLVDHLELVQHLEVREPMVLGNGRSRHVVRADCAFQELPCLCVLGAEGKVALDQPVGSDGIGMGLHDEDPVRAFQLGETADLAFANEPYERILCCASSAFKVALQYEAWPSRVNGFRSFFLPTPGRVC